MKKFLTLIKSNPIITIGVTLLVFGNLICYHLNGRLLSISTNVIIGGLVAFNIYKEYEKLL